MRKNGKGTDSLQSYPTNNTDWLGNHRKYICRVWIRIILWSAFLLGHWVATVGLGIISRNTLDESMGGLRKKCWGSIKFVVLVLGSIFTTASCGPDTITAYFQEDNELWLRHLVGLVFLTELAFYILLISLRGSSWLLILSILTFISGVIMESEYWH